MQTIYIYILYLTDFIYLLSFKPDLKCHRTWKQINLCSQKANQKSFARMKAPFITINPKLFIICGIYKSSDFSNLEHFCSCLPWKKYYCLQLSVLKPQRMFKSNLSHFIQIWIYVVSFKLTHLMKSKLAVFHVIQLFFCRSKLISITSFRPFTA